MRRKRAQDIEDEIVDKVVDVIMESMEKAKESVEDVLEEVSEIVEEHVEEAIDVAQDIVEGNEEVEKKSFIRRRKMAGELAEEFRKLWRTLLYMPEDNPELTREIGRKTLEDLRVRYGIDDETMYLANKFVEGVAEAQEERIRLRPEIDRIVREKYPWLFEDDDEE
jgi:Fe2+ transport system protein B